MNILFITSNRLGDTVLSTGLLGHLIAAHPDARITVVCGPVPAPLFAATPHVVRVIALAKRRWSLHWLGLWSATVGTVWDLVLDLRGSALGHCLLARRRRRLPAGSAATHQVMRLAQALDLALPPSPRLWPGERHRAEARRLIPDGGPVLAVGPTANWVGKQWPADRFAAAVQRLTAPDGMLAGARVAVFGASEEREAAAPLLASIPAPHRIDLVGHGDLLTAYACLERSSFYIGNDSGLMHMAAASGIPTLGLFGPSREDVYGPWGANTASVRTRESLIEIVNRPGYDYRNADNHMGSLSVDMVVSAAERLWRRVREAA
ncbi:MAG TPA: glycosyltransferase family 9 protein [Candidatus Sulfotelmatobacter sp.]|nr:glycosyltransferase family 9 protein [Candidatus Sulfotelmatobacter sp.]